MGVATICLAAAGAAQAQRRAVPRPPRPPHHDVIVRGHVFIGGYFYDPMFGRYPWWSPVAYPWYFPVYDRRADIRIEVTPREAEVYVDGFYAGIVNDFDGLFQALPLPPGGHAIVLYLEGYRTSRYNVYLHPGSTFKLRDVMPRLAAGVASEPPPVAAPLPPPPAGSYRMPRTPARSTPGATPVLQAAGFGTLDLRVQPGTADVVIDGQRWVSSDEGHMLVQVPAGMHRVEIDKAGFRRYAADIEVRDGEMTPLNVSLMPTRG
jgi:hypothetical protein